MSRRHQTERQDRRRWDEAVTGSVLEGKLRDGDRAFVEQLAVEHPAHGAELEFLDRLGSLDDGPPGTDLDPAGIDLVDRALAQREAQAQARAAGEPEESSSGAESKPMRRWWVAAGVLVAAAGAGALAQWGPSLGATAVPAAAVAELTLSSGTVQINGAPTRRAGTELGSGDTIAVGEGHACFHLDTGSGDGIDVCLDRQTTATLEALETTSRRVQVVRGRGVASLAPQPPGSDFSLRWRDVRATAVGTVFSLTAPTSRTDAEVRVLEGRVAVVGGEAGAPDWSETVEAAEALALAPGQPLRKAVPQDAEAADRDLVARASGADGTMSYVSLQTEPAGAEVSIRGVSMGVTPLHAAVPAGEPWVELQLEGFTPIRQQLRLEPGEQAAQRFGLVAEAPAEAPADLGLDTEVELPESPTPRATSRARKANTRRAPAQPSEFLGVAREQLELGHTRKAAATYEKLLARHPGSQEAAAARVALARLYQDHLGRPRRALALYEAYLRRGGPLAEQARHGKIRIHRARGNTAQEQAAIREFLAAHPKSGRSPALRSRLERLDGTP